MRPEGLLHYASARGGVNQRGFSLLGLRPSEKAAAFRTEAPIRIRMGSLRGRSGVFELAMGVDRVKDPDPCFWGKSIFCRPRQLQKTVPRCPAFYKRTHSLHPLRSLRESSPSGPGDLSWWTNGLFRRSWIRAWPGRIWARRAGEVFARGRPSSHGNVRVRVPTEPRSVGCWGHPKPRPTDLRN